MVAWSMWAAMLIGLATGIVLSVVNPAPEEDPFLVAILPVSVIGFATVGALIASRRGNPIGWLYLVFAVALTLAAVSEGYVALEVQGGTTTGLVQVAVWISNVMIIPAFATVPLVFLIFPNGRLPSRRWRPLAWAMVALPVVGMIGLIIRPGPAGGTVTLPNPTGVESLKGLASVLMTIGGVGSVSAAIGCVVALALRFRRAAGEERQQIRWLVYTAAAAAFFLLATFSTLFLRAEAVGTLLFFGFVLALAVGVPVASGAAILKYRLYDLDVVLKKVVVFGLLAAFVVIAYVLVVIVVPGVVFGTGADIQSLVPFLAAGVLALLFQPVRRWATRTANRLVYGRRATPYEVLTEFSGRVAAEISADEVLPQLARTLSEGTGAGRAEVWLRVGGTLRREAAWPDADDVAREILLVGEELPALPGTDRAAAVRDRGELLGALAVTNPRGEEFTPTQQRLIEDLASHAGLVLRNVRLIEELRSSRQRIVAAQDEERRRLERNIHDGAQQQLVALAVKMRLVQAVASKDPAKAAELAEQAKGELQDALDDLRDLARGIYPPLLADQGLAAALDAQARKAAVPVRVEPNGVGRYPQEVEAGAYFCVLEALQNIAKYADASRVEVRLRGEDGSLVFEVTDDGRGFDPQRTPPGSGLTNMRDRLEALGGSVEISSRPGEGTTVRGRIPVEAGGKS
jgi:signal transduction histidine kinase